MMRQWISRGMTLLLLAAILVCATGCAWMGKAAGKAQAKVENKIDTMGRSYHDSYEQEKARSSPEGQQPKTETEEPREL